MYAAMSRMLRAPEVPSVVPPSSSSTPESGTDGGGGTLSAAEDLYVTSDLTSSAVENSSIGNEVSIGEETGAYKNVKDALNHTNGDHWTGKVQHTRRKDHVLQMNISLVRNTDGRPKFFNCALSEVEEVKAGAI